VGHPLADGPPLSFPEKTLRNQPVSYICNQLVTYLIIKKDYHEK
jgi:hypothetical protein